MSEKSKGPEPATSTPSPAGTVIQKVLESKDLLDGKPEIVIHHEGRLYRLRRTRLGKLILTA